MQQLTVESRITAGTTIIHFAVNQTITVKKVKAEYKLGFLSFSGRSMFFSSNFYNSRTPVERLHFDDVKKKHCVYNSRIISMT